MFRTVSITRKNIIIVNYTQFWKLQPWFRLRRFYYRLTTQKTSTRRITSHLECESSDDWWILRTKGQQCRACSDIIMGFSYHVTIVQSMSRREYILPQRVVMDLCQFFCVMAWDFPFPRSEKAAHCHTVVFGVSRIILFEMRNFHGECLFVWRVTSMYTWQWNISIVIVKIKRILGTYGYRERRNGSPPCLAANRQALCFATSSATMVLTPVLGYLIMLVSRRPCWIYTMSLRQICFHLF